MIDADFLHDPSKSVEVAPKFPRDVQRVKLKQKEEQQRSSGAGIVKKLRKVPLIDMVNTENDQIKSS
jgi:hypothetical protein